jgi:SH3-like domain-containing protein
MTILKPNFYKQFDSRWAKKSWRGCTMAAYACGEMSVCNIASALTQHSLTPPQVWNYAVSHGFMCPGAGTYWGGIDAMLKHYGISVVEQTHDRNKLKNALRKNYWAITIMHRGIWTQGGHFIVPYYCDTNGYVYISDSASYAGYRAKNTFGNLYSQSNNAWLIIDPKGYKRGKLVGSTKMVLYTIHPNSNNVRSGAGGSHKVVGTLKGNEKVVVGVPLNDWYPILKGEYKGNYIHRSNLSKYKHIAHTYMVVSTDGYMNIRAGYSAKDDIVGKVRKGEIIHSDKQRYPWAHIPVQTGITHEGWVKIAEVGGKKYLKKVK